MKFEVYSARCCIPRDVTELFFYYFDDPLNVGYIPNGVTFLSLGDWFNQPLDIGHIPDSVTHLVFGDWFDQPLKPGHIPDSVTHLVFGDSFNQLLDVGHIPDSVIHITFGEGFRNEFNNIPNSLESIICHHNNDLACFINVPLYIRMYITLSYFGEADPDPDYESEQELILSGVRHQLYIESGYLDKRIKNGTMEGAHYIDTIKEDGIEYLVVRGDDYVPMRAKSARK